MFIQFAGKDEILRSLYLGLRSAQHCEAYRTKHRQDTYNIRQMNEYSGSSDAYISTAVHDRSFPTFIKNYNKYLDVPVPIDSEHISLKALVANPDLLTEVPRNDVLKQGFKLFKKQLITYYCWLLKPQQLESNNPIFEMLEALEQNIPEAK